MDRRVADDLKLRQEVVPGDIPHGGGGNGGSDGNGAAAGGEGGAAGEGGTAGGENTGDTGAASASSEDTAAEIARLKAEMAKQKAALDKATHEASEYKKEMNKSRQALNAKMTQEEIDAANKQEAEEKVARELEELRRKVAKGEAVKSVMGKLGLDEESAGSLAEALYGAADVENVLLLIQKSWQIREAALRKEFGKITGPGAGADSNSPEAAAIRRAQEIGKSRNAISEQAQKTINAYLR